MSRVHLRTRRALRPAVLGAVLIAASIALAGAFTSAAPARPFKACTQLDKRNLEMQTNIHAYLLLRQCTGERGGTAGFEFSSAERLASRPDYGGVDRNVINVGEGVSPHVTQSESQVWVQHGGSTVVSAYNDSRLAPNCYAGFSYSLNLNNLGGGVTWTNPYPTPAATDEFCGGHGTNFGDPAVVHDAYGSRWIAVWLAGGGDCGGQGLGVWTSTDAVNWGIRPCAHIGSGDDRESMWVDNSQASPYLGCTYISWNDFSLANNPIRVTHVCSGGFTWTTPVTVEPGPPFIRNVQITTGPDGTVFIAGMDEGGGGANPRTNIMYRSTNGGMTWTKTIMGAAFTPPGVANCGYFRGMYSTPAPCYFRHMGWGDVGVGPGANPQTSPNVVHYAYTQDAASVADAGDIYYTRSTDNGMTWSTPIAIPTSGPPDRTQWMPNLAVSPEGDVFVSWYEHPSTVDDYTRWGSRSNDGGATWEPAQLLSDGVFPKPLQLDPDVQPSYAGDYERSYADPTSYELSFPDASFFHVPWMDGRVSISGNPQQDEFYDKVANFPGPNRVCDFFADSAAPACYATPTANYGFRLGSTAGYTGEPFEDNHHGVSLPLTSYWLHYTPSTTRLVGFDTCNVGTSYDTVLAVYMGPDVVKADPVPGASNDDMGSACSLNPLFSRVSFIAKAGTPYHIAIAGFAGAVGPFKVDWSSWPLAQAVTGSYTPPPPGAGVIEEGTWDIGNHCDDCTTTIATPFPIRIYNHTYGGVTVSSNGNLQFGTANPAFAAVCLPWSSVRLMIAPHWDDLRTDLPTSVGFGGIYTATTGVTPNRRFIIEWQTVYFSAPAGETANFEAIFNESGSPSLEMQYGTVVRTGGMATVGVQGGPFGPFTQYECGTPGTVTPGLHLNWSP